MEEKLKEMMSESAIAKLQEVVKENVGELAYPYIYPAVVKALVEGDGSVREAILIDWLDVEFCRVCGVCGKIMEEGWYNCGKYACSDECVIKQDGITREEFDRFQIYKSTIQAYLDDGNAERMGYPKNADDLDDIDIENLIEDLLESSDAYYTSWND